MAPTRSRPPRGREQARHASGGAIAEHASKIYGVAIAAAIIILAVLTLTSIGHVIDAAVQHFMLFYAGVFTLIALCASVGLGLVATDRMVLDPGHRVFVQSAHRAVSFGAIAFLIVHIVTEILAQRVKVLDAFVPFLSPFRTFYIGLGTIASDLIILLVITSVFRKRFTVNGKAWRWRAIHYSAYVSFVFGVWHGLLGGRPGKPYVDWSYGFVIALVALGLAIRMLASSLRPKETLSSSPVGEAGSPGSGPMWAASMFAQIGIAQAAAGVSTRTAMSSGATGRGELLAGPGTGPMAAMGVLPSPATADVTTGQQPVFESGYDGPPRYQGAPRHPGPGSPGVPAGGMPRPGTGPMPRAGTGPMQRPGAGPMPRAGTGPMQRPGTGPMPRAGTGPMQRPGTGPMPRAGTGPVQRPGTGPVPHAGSGPMPRAGTGPLPRPGTGPVPHAGSGPMPRAGSGPYPAGPPDGADPRYPEAGPGVPDYRRGYPRAAQAPHGGQYGAGQYGAESYARGEYTPDPYAAEAYAPGEYGDYGYGWEGRR